MITDDCVMEIAQRLGKLENLSIAYTYISDIAVDTIAARLGNLRFLNVSAVSTITEVSWEKINVIDFQFSLECLGKSSSLKELCTTCNTRLRRHLPITMMKEGLEKLILCTCFNPTAEILAFPKSSMLKVRSISCSAHWNFSPDQL